MNGFYAVEFWAYQEAWRLSACSSVKNLEQAIGELAYRKMAYGKGDHGLIYRIRFIPKERS